MNKLVDVKTQLKELIENAAIKKFGGKVDSNSYQDANKKFVSTLNLSFTSNPSSTYIGFLSKQFVSRPQFKKIDAENEAARMTLDWLKTNMGLKWIDFK